MTHSNHFRVCLLAQSTAPLLEADRWLLRDGVIVFYRGCRIVAAVAETAIDRAAALVAADHSPAAAFSAAGGFWREEQR